MIFHALWLSQLPIVHNSWKTAFGTEIVRGGNQVSVGNDPLPDIVDVTICHR